MKRLIITDSTADLPPDLAALSAIRVIPVDILIDGRVYRDGIDICAEQFYARYDTFGQMTTRAVPCEAYIRLLRELADGHEEILAIHCSRHLSDTYNVALRAREALAGELNCRFEIVDSRLCSLALGMAALAAAEATTAGLPLEQTVARVKRWIDNTTSLLAVPTLAHLRRGGKISGLRARLESALGMRPIVEFHNGRLAVRTVCFGRHTNMLMAMLDQVRAEIGGRPITLALACGRCRQDLAQIRTAFEREFDCRRVYVGHFGPAVGIHAGPQCTGVIYHTH